MVVELRVDRPGIAPGVQRLRAADFACLVQASQMLETVEQQAATIVGRAEAVREQSRQEGLKQGRAEARRELIASVSDMHATLQRWVAQTEPQLVGMVLRCVREMVKGTDPQVLVRGSIARALAEMNSAAEIRIKVHESHVAELRAEVDELIQQYDLRGAVRVEASPTLRVGDCIVESPLGTVDLRMESQLKFVDQTLNPG
jgi:flagellar biosynthesis/type III secretory pathway protein FliH